MLLTLATMVATTSVLVLDLNATDVPPAAAKLLTELVTDRTAAAGVKTMSAQDLRRVAEFATEQAAVGCDTTSCLAEMANAMGTDFVLSGDVGKLGSAYIVTLRMYDAHRAIAVGRESFEAGSVDDMRERIGGAVDRLLRASNIGVVAAAPTGPNPALLWGGAAAAGVGVLVAAGCGFEAFVLDGQAGDKARAPSERLEALGTGRLWLLGAAAGGVLAVAGGAAAGAAFALQGE